MSFDQKKVIEAIRAIERGELVVVTDDDGRENEADLVMAAVHCTAEKMAFIVRHTSGIVCTPMTRDIARRLNLTPMVADNDAPHATAFTISVDFKHGTSTGISADDRTLTVRNLANANTGPADFVRPGHIFPLVARDGGVLVRSGHTEAAVDLCMLADLPPVGVICELVNDDGSVMRGDQITGFAAEHGLKQVSVANLIASRQRLESLVERVGSQILETPVGPAKAYTYSVARDSMHHIAVVFGDVGDGRDVPVRLHLESVLSDVFGQRGRLDEIMAKMAANKRGVLVYLREGSVGVGWQERSRIKRVGDDEHHDEAREREHEWREIGIGAQILRDLGIRSMSLVTSRERHFVGIEGFGIEITGIEAVA